MKHPIIVSKNLEEKSDLDSIAKFLKEKNISFGIYRNELGYYFIRRKAYPEDIEKAKKDNNYKNTYFKDKMGKEKLIEEYKEIKKRCRG